MAFQLSGKLIALHFKNSPAEAYLCNKGGTASIFLSRLVCHILNMANKHCITLVPAYITTHLNVVEEYLVWGKLVPEWQLLLPHIAQAAFQLWSQP